METLANVDIWGIALNLLAISGAAAWAASFLTNKRGQNKALDFLLDVVELFAANINKAKNDPSA